MASGPRRYLAAAVVLVTVLAPSGMKAKDTSSHRKVTPPGRVSGAIVAASRSWDRFTVKDREGNKRPVELPADARVEKAADISDVHSGDAIRVQFETSAGTDEIYLAQIDRTGSHRPAPSEVTRDVPMPPTRYWGTVSAVNTGSRRISIRAANGETRSFSVRESAFIVIVGTPSLLNKGDLVTVLFDGEPEKGEPRLVIVRPPKRADKN